MLNIVNLSENDFMQWLKDQLEKREFRLGGQLEREKGKELLDEILFYEQGLCVEDIERYFLPFGQSGYLTTRQKFEIMLFVLEKDYGSCSCFLDGVDNFCVISAEDVEAIYLQWLQEERLFLSGDEKREFFIQTLLDKLGLGIIEVLKRVAPDGILLGEFCPDFFGREPAEAKVAVCSQGIVIRFPFLALDSKEELIRTVKGMLAQENRGELTMMEPIIDFVKDDGRDWGIRILYSAARKGGVDWKN